MCGSFGKSGRIKGLEEIQGIKEGRDSRERATSPGRRFRRRGAAAGV
jgi:hypothetical protein